MKRRILTGIAAGLALLGAGAAQAKPIPEAGITPAEMAELLQESGYRAQTVRVGDTLRVESSSQGLDWGVAFYECEGGRCKDIQFFIGIDLEDGTTYSAINRWNREMRFGRAYLDEEMDPWLELDVDLSPGGSTEQVSDSVATWDAILSEFREHMGF